MKIGFLNPWRVAAENQAFSSLRIAAERLGHELVHCANSEEVERHAPAFVLASASTQPKLADVPHYGVIHEPRDRFLAHREYFENLLSYDGYLTISETLHRFLADVTFGAGRGQPIGYYYNTCQRQEAAADLESLIGRRALRIAYFGTNWDRRREGFFRILSETEGVEICGPAHSWPHVSPGGYGGTVAFDGTAVQERYAANGIGLCMLSDQHLQDDIVSNRIFEITSVGAIALCCEIPWIRKHFGDSVYYFDQRLPDLALRRAILRLRDSIYADPAAAIEKAKRARAIFESNFAAEIMIDNAVKYHATVCSARESALRQAEAAYSPFISAIVRCGSRPIEYVERAVRSIASQTFGQFEVILVRHRELDVTRVVEAAFPRIRQFRVVDCPGGNRSASLWRGLQAVSGDYFAILDDDDWWFSGHFERLFHPWPNAPQQRYLAYSGTIVQHREPHPIRGGAQETREVYAFGIQSRECWRAAAAAFASNCFVASSDLLDPELLTDPGMETAEDSYLIVSLMSRAEPRFSFAATSVFDRSLAEQSRFAEHPARHEDELTLQLRLFGAHRPRFFRGDAWTELAELWRKRPLPASPPESDTALPGDWEQVGGGYDRGRSGVGRGSRLIDPIAGKALVRCRKEPWSYGVMLQLNPPERACLQYFLVAELAVRKGVIGVGLLNLDADDFIFRASLAAQAATQTVRIPIPNFSRAGRFVIQNWDTRGKSRVELLSLRLLGETA
jgi:hypothetical protein